MNVWKEAKKIVINSHLDITNEFKYEVVDDVSDEMVNELIKFMDYVEANYNIATPIDVLFINQDYLIDRNNKQVGYIFYYPDFKKYPNIYTVDDIPIIELPVKEGKWSKDEILTSFIEALTMYFVWIMNRLDDEYEVDDSVVDYILEQYKKTL